MSNISISLSFITNAKEIQIIIPTPPPPPPPTTTMIIQQYNVPTIVYRASFIVRRRTSCTDNRRELFYAYNNQPSASYHLFLVPLTALAASSYRQQQYDNGYIVLGYTIVDTLLPLCGGGEMYHTSAQSLNNTQINANTTINRAAHTNCRAAAPVMRSTSQRR